MPLISVSIPVYNGERTIRETIESVLHQTIPDLELIIINDGSSDRTLEVVSEIEDPRLRVFSYPNAGQAASRNLGLSQARGDYISFIDADDLWTPDKLEAQFNALQANPDAAVAYSWTDWIDESGNFLRPASRGTHSGDVLAILLLNDFIGSGSNALIRTEALRAVGGFDESLPPAEDWDLWLRLARRYCFVAVPQPHVLYRQLTQSASVNVWKMEQSSLKIIDRAFREAPESLQYLKRSSLGNRYKYLTFKSLDGLPNRSRGWTAMRYFWRAFTCDPALLRTRVFWKVWLKIVTFIALPSGSAKNALDRLKGLANINTLISHHMQIAPF